MTGAVKRRAYTSATRQRQAERTRGTVLAAARTLFVERGYAGTTMAAVAAQAGVALDTVYASVGRKPELFRLLLETAISGRDEAVPPQDREYVKAIVLAGAASEKIRLYAAATTRIQAGMAPLVVVLQAAAAEPGLAALAREIAERRAANMHLYAADLASTGELRPGLTVDEVADVVWSMSASEYYLLLVQQRGWSPERFERWLAEAWCRLFLA